MLYVYYFKIILYLQHNSCEQTHLMDVNRRCEYDVAGELWSIDLENYIVPASKANLGHFNFFGKTPQLLAPPNSLFNSHDLDWSWAKQLQKDGRYYKYINYFQI